MALMIHITPVYDLEDEEEDEDDEDGIGQFVGHLDVVLLGVVVRQHLAGGDLAEHHPVPAILPAHHFPRHRHAPDGALHGLGVGNPGWNLHGLVQELLEVV